MQYYGGPGRPDASLHGAFVYRDQLTMLRKMWTRKKLLGLLGELDSSVLRIKVYILVHGSQIDLSRYCCCPYAE